MKNNRSAGIDNIHTKHIKYLPPSVHQLIADTFNQMAKSGKCPNENYIGLLIIPLKKPDKKRPIILCHLEDSSHMSS